jgi:hypothetical protein
MDRFWAGVGDGLRCDRPLLARIILRQADAVEADDLDERRYLMHGVRRRFERLECLGRKVAVRIGLDRDLDKAIRERRGAADIRNRVFDLLAKLFCRFGGELQAGRDRVREVPRRRAKAVAPATVGK